MFPWNYVLFRVLPCFSNLVHWLHELFTRKTFEPEKTPILVPNVSGLEYLFRKQHIRKSQKSIRHRENPYGVIAKVKNTT